MQRLFKIIGGVSVVALTLSEVVGSSAQTSSLPDRALCVNALNRERSVWNSSTFFSEDVAEAARRGLTIAACRQLIAQSPFSAPSEYQPISVETFVLDGRDLASKATKVSLGGVYIRQGNLDVLYANVQAAMIANSRGLHQPNVPLLTDDASREFRQHLLMCQSNPASAEMGCSVTVLGRVITCKLSNAYGATREEPCVAVEDGRQ
jgi:hypothetical protein